MQHEQLAFCTTLLVQLEQEEVAAGHSRLSRPLLLITSLWLMLGDWQKAVQHVSPSQMASSKEGRTN